MIRPIGILLLTCLFLAVITTCSDFTLSSGEKDFVKKQVILKVLQDFLIVFERS